ncbi:carboxypeptidase-like regulatory domain-containing protein [Pedobacter sp. NJ-S-72]
MNGMKKSNCMKRDGIFLLVFLSLLTISQNLFAQERQLSGKVTGASDGQPIPGAVVQIKNKTSKTGTNNDGLFAIAAETGDILRVSFVGYQTKEVLVGTAKTIQINLVEEDKNLEEVVVVGYGVQRKKNYGCISAIKRRCPAVAKQS